MSHNSFGHLFRVTTWGESHGPAIGCIVDGCPPGIALTEADIQPWLDRRKPGQSKFTTQRREADEVRILSGVFEGRTTGTPIALEIQNTDQRSKDYSDIATRYRPGHADVTYDMKYGHRDYRGGGRSSARETASRVAAGAVARRVLAALSEERIVIRAALSRIGALGVDRDRWDWAETLRNPLFCPDAATLPAWEALLGEIRKAGSSIGAVVDVVAEGAPGGLGAPIYGKLDADIAAAMMSINGVKGVEIGDGFEVASLRGEQNGDPMRMEDGRIAFESNHAGGILGGISTGQPIVARFAIKPTSSILVPVPSVNRDGEEIDVVTRGRHDPCIGIRAAPVAEAMMACVLADHWLRHRGQVGGA
ncbi:chorismate synthase [Neoasaia chiangmaiensis NBRC 101099]|uniref:Chorismate synthase n=1 Tax=Neoasaia chiangmaiensis TaxID=320497 RepID=A0A1U9KN92_9PROT|nr:chorismate synthase [Neoasaia chiangmaiensis]AQS87263.1 chorismate synthase [Neoasaia chiangmaiensis]GBR38493.1 chorismate synthase [Neoasaia chiangmaiensis NBRC 101099]GEN15871.1 chorismate synthase [Neoasaia chiangmaiensis]